MEPRFYCTTINAIAPGNNYIVFKMRMHQFAVSLVFCRSMRTLGWHLNYVVLCGYVQKALAWVKKKKFPYDLRRSNNMRSSFGGRSMFNLCTVRLIEWAGAASTYESDCHLFSIVQIRDGRRQCVKWDLLRYSFVFSWVSFVCDVQMQKVVEDD